MIRRYGETPRPGQVYRRRPGVYAILPMRGGLLLTAQMPGPDLQLPGGGIDPGESPLRALHREVMEETGWRIAAPRRLGAFRRYVWMPEYGLCAEKLCHVYLARPVRAHGLPTEAGHVPFVAPLELAAEMLGNAGDRAFVAAFARQSASR
ncbi:NUDIX domain-containing protein [Pseudoroseicyclus aestuarii]|uniref:8-oxo-dGTP diphosphatase n=1 Tax=Pseudoroseicyclus aestuarii TaxID=1795041 RepID=A0A318SX06_9RHOB|nr:NUDIX hydrolase [Pseudoroseicyclus aestuarii]PYE84357.1 8-oxo-dGTP diphosphatase [Pseudoroseicyclus aestuarii]